MGSDLNYCIERKHMALDGTHSRAIYSKCEKYRYFLERRFVDGASDKIMTMIMLNPSTATEQQNDPTVARCERRARIWGFAALRVLNIFAYRATDPKDMRAQSDPIGPLNNQFIENALKQRNIHHSIICGWGTHGSFMDREQQIWDLFAKYDFQPFALDWTKDGHPKHPLYVGYDRKPKVRGDG